MLRQISTRAKTRHKICTESQPAPCRIEITTPSENISEPNLRTPFHNGCSLHFATALDKMSMNPATENKSSTAVTWETIQAAHARIAPCIHRAPIMTSSSLDTLVGARIFFKCENLQKTGSFKIRGASNAIFSLTDDEVRHGIVTQSSGNHGAAVACAAAWRKVPAWIVMPKNSSAVKRQAIEGYGGRVVLCEPTMTSRNETCNRILNETHAHLVHPFDDDRVIAGQATSAKELLEDVEGPRRALRTRQRRRPAQRHLPQRPRTPPRNARLRLRARQRRRRLPLLHHRRASIHRLRRHHRRRPPRLALPAHLRHPPRKSRRRSPRHRGRNHLRHALHLGAPQNCHRAQSPPSRSLRS